MKKKFLAVALLGAANAGKSTLANRLSGKKLSITSHRPQTTRRIIHAVFNHGDTQILLSDTPGLTRNLRHGANEAKAADHSLMVVDCLRPTAIDERLPFDTLIINKCDKATAEQIAAVGERETDSFALSALTGDGVGELRHFLLDKAAVGDWLYPAGTFSNLTAVMQAEEFTREQLLRRLKYELPYEVLVKTEEFARKNRQLRISQRLVSGKISRKKIVVGKNGGMLKRIGAAARRNMEQHFGCRVHLFLQVS